MKGGLLAPAVVTLLLSAPAAPPTAAADANADGSAPPPCQTFQLAADIRMLSPGAGQRHAALSLTNISSRPCHLRGYPGLQLRTDAGDAPTTVLPEPRPGPRRFTLAPGQLGWSRLHWTVVPPDCVAEITSVRVTPPAETRFLTVPAPLGSVCQHGSINVTVLSPDPPGS